MSDKLIEAVAEAIHAQEAVRIGKTRAWSSETTDEQDLWLGDARAALAAIEASGYRVVPKEPTEAMLKHAKAWGSVGGERVIWDAMLAAATKVTP